MELHSGINGCDNYDNHSLSPLRKTLFNLLTLKPMVMQIDIHSCHAMHIHAVTMEMSPEVTVLFLSTGQIESVPKRHIVTVVSFVCLLVYAASVCLLLNLPCFMHDMTDAPAMSFVT